MKALQGVFVALWQFKNWADYPQALLLHRVACEVVEAPWQSRRSWSGFRLPPAPDGSV